MPVRLLADMLLHPFGLIHLVRVALRLLCVYLPLRAVDTHLFQHIPRQAVSFPFQDIFLQQTMHHQVGIPPNRRGEVGVMLKSQPVVPDVLRRVLRFRHRPNGQHVYHLRGHTLAHTLLKGFQLAQLLLVGLVVNTIHKRLLPHRFRHRPVRQQHELLYQVVRLVRSLKVYLHRLTLLIQPKAHLILLQHQRPRFKPLTSQYPRYLV